MTRGPQVSKLTRRHRLLSIGEQRLQSVVDKPVNVVVGRARLNGGCDEGFVPPGCPLQNGEFQCVQCAGPRVVVVGFRWLHPMGQA
jgi:hypothetical protein